MNEQNQNQNQNQNDQNDKPFRLLDLPIEVQIHLIHIIVQISIDQSTNHRSIQSSQSDEDEDEINEEEGPIPINWSILINLASTCHSLYQLCSPFYLRRLVISSGPTRPAIFTSIPSEKDQLSYLLNITQDHLNLRASTLRHVTTIFYNGTTRMRLCNPLPSTLEITHQLLNATPKLRSLCLSNLPTSTVTCFLRHPLPSLEALAISYITTNDELNPNEFQSLKGLKALKIQECTPIWLEIAKRIENIQHLCIWMPVHQIKDLDWFLPKVVLPNLRYLNLDGFKDHPKILAQLCDLIRTYRLEGGKFVIEELDLEARFTGRLVEKVLSAVEGYEGLKSLAISCVVARDMNPDLFDAIGRAGIGAGLERLLVMVDGYEGKRWPGNLAHYAARLSRFTRLRTFAFNHVDQPGSIELEEEDGELVIIDNSRTISPNFMEHASMMFGSIPTLRSVVLVKSLWANRADGAKAWKDEKDGEIRVLNQLDLRETLIPFEPRWTD